MFLTSLTLQNFRSYEKKTFTFSPQTTLLSGTNGAGKTNILEAIMIVATGKSFRAERNGEVIRWDTDFAKVKASADGMKLDLVITPNSKKFFLNGIARRQIDFVGNLRAVLFWPEDLGLVTDSPSVRRRYLDMVLVQVDREYRRNLASYERGLRQRNRLLDFVSEGKAHRHQLLFWNQLLIQAGGYLTDKRAELIDFINSYHVSRIKYHLMYDKSVISEARLAQYAEEEIAAKVTLVGPHRDDFSLSSNDKNLTKFGSRGEQRLAVLWLKLAEVAYFEKETGVRPLLLLDDILSELDLAHREIVLSTIGEQQTILTSADPAIINRGKSQWQQINL